MYAVTGAIGAILIIGTIVWLPHSAPSSNCMVTPQYLVSGGQWYTMAPCNTNASMDSHSYYPPYQIVRLSDSETVYGQYSANLSIGAYMLNASEVQALEGDPHPTSPPPSYFWTCGTVAVCNLSVKVPGSPGQYYIVLENLNPAPVAVQWTKVLAIYYTPV